MRDAINGHINHSRTLKHKVYACIIPGCLFFLFHNWPIKNWLQLLTSIFLTGSWFMFLFNGYWGWKVAKDPFYRSTAVGKNLSRFDRFFMHWPKLLYALFMLALVAGSTWLYIKAL